nr:hypothetical protein [Tanacetum cinerariifolium]
MFNGGCGGSKVEDVSLVDGVFDGALGGDRDEDLATGEGVRVSSSSWVKSTKSFLGGIRFPFVYEQEPSYNQNYDESNVENLLPIPSECEVTLEDKRECGVPILENSPVCDNHSDIFSDSKIDDDISVYDDDFKDIEYVEALLSDPEIVSVEEENGIEEENVVQQEEEEVDLEDISQIQDIVLREK